MVDLSPLAAAADLATILKTDAEDADLVSALKRSSNRFRGAVRWLVSETEAQVKLDGLGRRSVRLPGAEVSEVSSVKLEGVELTETTDYEWSRDGILDRVAGVWPERRRIIEVTYTYGYPEIPEDIQEVVLDQAAALYRIKRGLSSEQVGGISRVYGREEATGVTQQWADAVNHYRISQGDRA
jgi:hypothetical protein